jgi:hypothetical protein
MTKATNKTAAKEPEKENKPEVSESQELTRLLLQYDLNLPDKKRIDAARRIRIPTIKDRVSACRYSMEEFGAESMDVVVSYIASLVLRFGKHTDEGSTPGLVEDIVLPVDMIIDNFDYDDLLRVNALMGKGTKHPMTQEQIRNLIDENGIVPLHQPYTVNGCTINAAMRTRRPVVRDHITARSFSMEKWGYHFTDVVMAGTAASTMKFGTLSTDGGTPHLINQTSIELPFMVEHFLFPDLMLLNNLLVKTQASSVSGAKP